MKRVKYLVFQQWGGEIAGNKIQIELLRIFMDIGYQCSFASIVPH